MQKKKITAALWGLQLALLTGCGQVQAAPEEKNLQTRKTENVTVDKAETPEIQETGAEMQIQESENSMETQETENTETDFPETLHFVDALGEAEQRGRTGDI